MERVLIIGYGNPLRSDDGVGWLVAQRLLREGVRSDVRVMAAQQLTPEMAEDVSRVEKVLFVDAARSGAPGSVGCVEIVAVEAGADSHEVSPRMILALAKDLYGRSPRGFLLTVAGESFETGETMSAAVSAAIPELMRRIRDIVDSA